MSSDYYGAQAGELAGADEDDYDGVCDHYCDEDCEDGCHHEHCFNCGGCGCPGYCDDYQTYNLRPDETGGDPDEDGHQRYKDGLAQGPINPPDECEGALDPRAEDGGSDNAWALPEGETYDTESPF